MKQKNDFNLVTDITVIEAWEILKKNSGAHLIDVRTEAEIIFVGYPTLKSIDKEVIFIPWLFYPGSILNQDFKKILCEQFINKDDHLLFICRTGGRSGHAAIVSSEFGYKNCYNIEDGFEGDMNSLRQRGKISGWKFFNLPWEQT